MSLESKTARDICMRTLYIEFERDRPIGLGFTFGDGYTDRQTDTQTDTQTDKKEFKKCDFRFQRT